MNQFGLVDARAIVTLILTAKRYRPHDTVKMTKAAISVAGDDVTGLMILEAGPGVQLRVEVEGPRAPALLDELTDLFNHRFYLEE